MYYTHVLKPDKSIVGLVPAIISLVIFGIASVLFGMGIGLKVLGAVILIYSVFTFIAAYKTNSLGYKISALYMLSFGLYLNLVYWDEFSHGDKIILTQEAKIVVVFILFFLAWLIYLLFTKRIKWRGREIMALAAMGIEPGENTYTDRPRPVQKLEYNREQLQLFADFLKSHLIALPYFERDRVLLLPIKMGFEYPYLFGGNLNYWEKTWIAFDYDGTVTVHISQQDYLDYKDDLAFDPLCTSFGELFIDFFEKFNKGESVRIIDRINEIKVGFFS